MNGHRQARMPCPKSADTVAKLENRTRTKKSCEDDVQHRCHVAKRPDHDQSRGVHLICYESVMRTCELSGAQRRLLVGGLSSIAGRLPNQR